MNLDDMPNSLHALQYAAKVCEETLGLPATKGNLELVAACIEAVGKKLFAGRDDMAKMGCFVLNRRIEEAQRQGIKTTSYWLRDGGYWEIEKPRNFKNPDHYEHFGQGYNETDMGFLWTLYKSKREVVKRALSSEEIDKLLNELDEKRGRKPAWR